MHCALQFTHNRHFCMTHSRYLPSVIPPHKAVAGETQDKDGHTYAQQHLLYYLQHLDTGDDLLLKHVCRFFIQHSRLVT